MKKYFFWLKISRPGLWFPTIWLYLLPASQLSNWEQPAFWLGLFYVTFPLNFFIYGWNDIVDREIDILNPRKGNFLFGAQGTLQELEKLPLPLVISQIPFLLVFIYLDSWRIIGWFAILTTVNALYNWPKIGLRGRPPLELLNQFGYILVIVLSIWLNEVPNLPWQSYLYICLFCFQSHIMGEIMDIEADKKGGRKTTATVIGLKNSKIFLLLLVSLETILLMWVFQDFVLGGMLALFLIWLLLDYAVLFRDRFYSLKEMKSFGLLLNVVGFISMLWILFSQSLTTVP